jgi:hypothetical protein
MALLSSKFTDDHAKEVERIYRTPGPLTPFKIVEAAADPSSPLHDLFEWNDDEAAKAYRLDHARAVVQEVTYRVVVGTDEIKTRSFGSVHREGKREYVHVEDIARDEELLKAWETEQQNIIESLLYKMKAIQSLRAKIATAPAKTKRRQSASKRAQAVA